MSRKQSLQFTALEKNVSLRNDGLGAVLTQTLVRYGLFLLMLILILVFSVTTDTFASIADITGDIKRQVHSGYIVACCDYRND